MLTALTTNALFFAESLQFKLLSPLNGIFESSRTGFDIFTLT